MGGLSMSFYDNWRNMKRRCEDSEYHSYHRYGGRGIQVCDRWQDFLLFKMDMYVTYFPGASLDRIDNDKNYEASNCCWLAKGENKKTLIAEPVDVLDMYESGMLQKEIAEILNTDQPHVSRILKRARCG
jgi:hypothetical protein